MLADGMPQWMGYACGAAAGLAAVTDYRAGKVYNWLTLPLFGLGLLVAAWTGAHALLSASLGAGLALAIFLPLFLLGVFGAGDVKLLMALGAALGARGVFELACASILIAGAGSLALLARSGRLRVFLGQLGAFLRSLVTPGLEACWPKLDPTSKAPFSVAVFWGLLFVLLRGPK